VDGILITAALRRCGSDCGKDELEALFNGQMRTQFRTACTTLVSCGRTVCNLYTLLHYMPRPSFFNSRWR